MTAAEHLYKISQELPDDMLAELLDFAEFLKQKKKQSVQTNLALKIQQRFKGLDFDDVVLPARNTMKKSPF